MFSSLSTSYSGSNSGSNEKAEIVVSTDNEDLDLKVLEYIVFVLTDLLNYFEWPKENLGTMLKKYLLQDVNYQFNIRLLTATF